MTSLGKGKNMNKFIILWAQQKGAAPPGVAGHGLSFCDTHLQKFTSRNTVGTFYLSLLQFLVEGLSSAIIHGTVTGGGHGRRKDYVPQVPGRPGTANGWIHIGKDGAQ